MMLVDNPGVTVPGQETASLSPSVLLVLKGFFTASPFGHDFIPHHLPRIGG